MEYVDLREEKKKEQTNAEGSGKRTSPKRKTAHELMASFQETAPELAAQYNPESNPQKEETKELPESTSEQQEVPQAEDTSSTVPVVVSASSPLTDSLAPSGENNTLVNDLPLPEETAQEQEYKLVSEEITVTQESSETAAGTEDGTRITAMQNPSLDGSTSRIEALNTSVKEKTTQHLTTGSDEKVAAGIDKIILLNANEKEKESPEQKTTHIQNAVEEKTEDKQAETQAGKVSEIASLPKPVAQKEDAQNTLHSAIQSKLPTTVEGVESFKKDGIAQLIGSEVKNTVEEKTQEIHHNFSQIENTNKPADPKTPVPLAEIEKSIPTPELNLGAALIPKLEEETLDLSVYQQESDHLLQREGIKQEHLEMADSGDLAEARSLLDDVKKQSEQEPAALRQQEQEEHAQVNKELHYHETLSKEKMEKERSGQLNDSKKLMGGGVNSMETKRREVTEHIQGIYETTNQKVQEKLKTLLEEAFKKFEKEEKEASTKFSNNVATRLDAFKQERYSGTTGGLVEWWDEHLGDLNNNPEVKKILNEEKEAYISTLDSAIGNIMNTCQKTIDECRSMVQEARIQLDNYVKNLAPDLQKIGKEAQENIKKKLDELDEKINQASEALKKELETKKAAAIASIEKKIDDLKESLKSTLGKAGDLLMDAALKFFHWALESAGYAADQFIGLLNKGKAVITAVVNDPVQFMNNLSNAVGGGIQSFGANIQEHLGEGFMSWLTGKMNALPIQLPEKWDLKGIMSLVMQVLGLGWGMLRGKLSQRVGEDKMAFVENHAEEGLEIVGQVKEKGPIALWDMVAEKGEEIKDGLLGGTKEWATIELVKQGIIRLVSMLNPAGAIVQAILAIYGGVMFFVNNKDRMVEFVNSILNSISSIASGAISAAAKLVEKSMAMTIPLILDFLAQMLNLGGIAERITKIIQRIRKPIDEVMDKIIQFFINKIKKLFGKIKNSKKTNANNDKDDSVNSKENKKTNLGKESNNQKESKEKSKEDFDKDKGDDKTTELDRNAHEKYVVQIDRDFKIKSTAKTLEIFYREKQDLARNLEKKYQGLVKESIKVSIFLEPFDNVKTDNDIRYKITITPNATFANGTIEFNTIGLSKEEEVLLSSLAGGKKLVETLHELKGKSSKYENTLAEAKTALHAISSGLTIIFFAGSITRGEGNIHFGSPEAIRMLTEIDVFTMEEMIEVKAGDYSDEKKLSGRDLDQFTNQKRIFEGKTKIYLNGKQIMPPRKWIYQFSKPEINLELQKWLMSKGVTEVRTGK